MGSLKKMGSLLDFPPRLGSVENERSAGSDSYPDSSTKCVWQPPSTPETKSNKRDGVIKEMGALLDGAPRLEPASMNSRTGPFRGAWRESGSSGLFGLSRLFGSMNKRDKTDPRTRETALGSSFVKRRSSAYQLPHISYSLQSV